MHFTQRSLEAISKGKETDRMTSRGNLLAAVSFIMSLANAQSFSVQHRYKSLPFYYLNVSSLETILVSDYLDCSFACLQNVLCVSFNVAAFSDENWKRWCELLPSTNYNNTVKLTADHQSRHYSLQVSAVDFIPSTSCSHLGRVLISIVISLVSSVQNWICLLQKTRKFEKKDTNDLKCPIKC